MKYLRTLHLSPILLVTACMLAGVVFVVLFALSPLVFAAGGSGGGDGSGGSGSGDGSGDGDGGTSSGSGSGGGGGSVSCDSPQAWPWGVNCVQWPCNVYVSPSNGPDPRMVWWNGTTYNPMNWAIDGVWQPGVIGSGQYINFAGYGEGNHTITIQSQPGEYYGPYINNMGEVVDAYIVYSCSTGFSNPQTTDLVSSALAIQGGATTMTQNQSYVLTATVTNSGGTAAGAFSDSFAFGYGGSGGSFTVINTTAKAGLAASATSGDTSSSFSPASAGTITVRHCVDTASQISESNEANNCTYRDYTVSGSVTASCSVSPTSVSEDENATWTASASGGTPGYSYAWSGTDSLSGSGTSTVKSYVNSGTKTGSVNVTDSLGISSGMTACSLPVLSVIDNDPVADIEARVLGSGAAWSDGPITISALEEVELRWDSTNATSCTGDTNYSTGGAQSGTTGVVAEAPGGQSRTYTVTCSKPGDSDQDTVQVDRDVPVSPPTITANPDRVREGETTTLTGNLNGHTGCTIIGGGTNIPVPDGTLSFSYTSAAILGETTLTLDCSLGDGSDVVRILPAVEHI